METLESPLSHEPRYRINAVSEMTGLSAPNLRAWERRYGIPNPQRGENAYRLYSNRDITLLRKMKALCDEGHAPSDAAKLATTALDSREEGERVLIGFEDARRALVKATQDFNPVAVDQILAQLPSFGSAWMMYEQTLEPALVEIGELWEQDERYVAHEHMLSQAVKSHLTHLLQLLQPPYPRKRIIFACVSHELHDLPIYALALRASHMGCLPIMLGSNTPPEALATAVKSANPQGVILSATTALTPRTSSNVLPALMGQYESASEPPSWEDRSDLPTDTTSLKLTPPPVRREDLLKDLRAYQSACGDVPWLIGGRAMNMWSEFPEDLRAHVTSERSAFDQLVN